jgi:DNA-binding Lrp family transcriptional regulator
MSAPARRLDASAIDALDRRIIAATQAGLPLTERPYAAVAAQVGLSPAEVMARMQRLLSAGVIRRIGVVPNHYALGYCANGMSVWDVPDDRIGVLGSRVGRLPFVSHCYQRPRQPPLWSYNLFAMVHGRARADVEANIAGIARLLGRDARAHDVLFSTRILKKTGLRIAG